MLGYESYFEKSLNGIKTLSDGKTIIKNGTITTNRINSDHLNVDNFMGDAMNAYNLNILDVSNNVIISNAEFLTLNGSDTSTTIQDQLEDLKNNVEVINNLLGEDLNINIENLGQRLDEIEDDVLLLQTDLDTAEQNINDLTNEVASLNTKTNFNTLNTQNLNIMDVSGNFIITNDEFLFLDGMTGDTIQTQLNNLDTEITGAQENIGIITNEVINLNNKVYNFRGAYDSLATYFENDMVRYNNALYFCIVDNTTNILPVVNTNWTLYLDSVVGAQGERGERGERGPRGPAPDDGDDGGGAFFGGLAGGIIGGIAGGAGAVGVGQFIGAMQDAGFATLENLGDNLDQAYEDWEIQSLKDKTQYQSASSLSTNTTFKSDLTIQNSIFENKIILNQSGKIDTVEIEASNINVNNDLYVADQINGAGNWNTSGNLTASGSNITLGSSTQLGTVVINGFVSMPLMQNFFGFNVVDGYINQV